MFNFPSVPQQKWLPIAPGVCSLCVCVCVCVYVLEWLIEADESLSFRNEIAIFLQLIVEHYQ